MPWSVFRAVSDRATDGSVDDEVFRLSRPDGTPDPAAVPATSPAIRAPPVWCGWPGARPGHPPGGRRPTIAAALGHADGL